MLSQEKHCEILDLNLRDKIAAIYASFRLFIQLFSAIVAGAIALHLQGAGKIPASFVPLSNFLAALVALTCAVMILDAQFSWRRFRKKLSEIAPEVSAPRPLLVSSVTVISMLAVMAMAVLAFWAFNPLVT